MTSSATAAVADDPVRERVRGAAVAVVEDRERVGVLAFDQGHQILVGESLQCLGCERGVQFRRGPSRDMSLRDRSHGGSVASAGSEIVSPNASRQGGVREHIKSSTAVLHPGRRRAGDRRDHRLLLQLELRHRGHRGRQGHRRGVRDPRRQRLAQHRAHPARRARAGRRREHLRGADLLPRRRPASTCCSRSGASSTDDGGDPRAAAAQRRGQRPAPAARADRARRRRGDAEDGPRRVRTTSARPP